MTQYIIYFNQEWVGDHTAEWFQSRGPLARAVVDDMKAAGVLVVAAGVDEDVSAVPYFELHGDQPVLTKATLTDGYIGGLTIVDAATEEEAIRWGEKIASACGWPQVVRRLY